VVTAAHVHDKHPLPQLMHGAEEELYGDSAYASQRELIARTAPRAKGRTNHRVLGSGVVADLQRIVNRIKSKVRYRGLEKNATRAFVALGLANIYLARRRLAG
jgi:IS5 family transposase